MSVLCFLSLAFRISTHLLTTAFFPFAFAFFESWDTSYGTFRLSSCTLMRYLEYSLNGGTYVAGWLSQRFCDVSY